jgi:hypothetical protein
MSEGDDPRTFPDPAAAPAESACLHALAAASQAATTGQEAAMFDGEIRQTLGKLLLTPDHGERLASVFASAPSVATYRHLWRLLAMCERESGPVDSLAATLFALPIIIVAGIEGVRDACATLPCLLDDAAALAGILREHRALAGNQSFALANALVAAGAIDLAQLPDLFAWRALPAAAPSMRALEPAPITLSGGPETVHLRFLPGTALAARGADLLRNAEVGKWGIPFTQELGRQLGAPGISVLALPRAPQSLLHAVQRGRAAQREVGAQIFAGNAIRKLRASVGEPTAVISAHRAPDAVNGGEIRLSLSSPFDPREAEGFRCPLYPLDRVADVVAMLTELLGECRVSDVRVLPGIHDDRDPVTGLPLLFKGDSVPASLHAVH